MRRKENKKSQRLPLSRLSRTGRCLTSQQSSIKKGQSATNVKSLIALFSSKDNIDADSDKENSSTLHLNHENLTYSDNITIREENINREEQVQSYSLTNKAEKTKEIQINEEIIDNNVTRYDKLRKSRRILGIRLQRRRDEKKKYNLIQGFEHSRNPKAEIRKIDSPVQFDFISSTSSSAPGIKANESLELTFYQDNNNYILNNSIANNDGSENIIFPCDDNDISPIRKIRDSPITIRVFEREMPTKEQPLAVPIQPDIPFFKKELEIAAEKISINQEKEHSNDALKMIQGALRRHKDASNNATNQNFARDASQKRRVVIRDDNNTIRIFTRTKEEEAHFGRERGRKSLMRRNKWKNEVIGPAYSEPLPYSPEGMKTSCVGVVKEHFREVERTGFELGKQILFLADDLMTQCAQISITGNENANDLKEKTEIERSETEKNENEKSETEESEKKKSETEKQTNEKKTWSHSALKLGETIKKSSEQLNLAFKANCGSPNGVEDIFLKETWSNACSPPSEAFELERSLSDSAGPTILLDQYTPNEKAVLINVNEGATETETLPKEKDHLSSGQKGTKPILERSFTDPNFDWRPNKFIVEKKYDIVQGEKRWNKAQTGKSSMEDAGEDFFRERTRKHLCEKY